MVGLFNSFDSICFLGSMVWGGIFLALIFPNSKLFFLGSRFFFLLSFMFFSISKIFGEMNQTKNMIGIFGLFMSLFFFIFFLNFMSLFGYFFSCTGHLVINLCFGLMFWGFSMVLGLSKSFLKLVSHFAPNNTPLVLLSFLILIEMLSVFMRPFVLAVRLTANLFAGHLLMCLISSFKLSLGILPLSIFIQSLFLCLETMVAMIQAYIFTLLSVNYMGDIVN